MGLLDGRVAIVTGAGHGIGRGHALELAKEGAKVLVNDLGTSLQGEGTGKDADLTVDLIRERGGEAAANYENVADFDGAGRMVQQAINEFGRLDILVNNAGIARDATIWSMTEADWDAVINVHLKGTFAPTHHAVVHWRGLSKAGEDVSTGRIINTTSGAGLSGNFGQANYTTAKAGLAAFTMTVSLEVYRMGITCNAIGPAGATRMAASIPGAGIEAKEPDEFDEWNPMDPSLSSPIVAWLASDQASHVTGQVIRAVRDEIVHMLPWSNGNTVSKPGKRWEPSELSAAMNTDIFHSRHPVCVTKFLPFQRRRCLVSSLVVQCTPMTGRVATAKVSHRGQTALPAELRRRWGIEDGGEVTILDLGDVALLLPAGVEAARRELRRVLIDEGGYEAGLATLDDPDLADQ